MRFSHGRGYEVISTSSAETVGKVDQFVVDPRERTVVALTLKKTDEGDTLRWSDIRSFGDDAVTVEDAAAITETPDDIAALAGKERELVGKRVLSTGGDELGKIADVEFDVESGALTGLLLDDAELAGERLVGVGSYAVVVRAED